MSFAWTRNFYAIAETPFPTVFCFESKRSRNSAVNVWGLKAISAKDAGKMWDYRLNQITDRRYQRLRTKYLLTDADFPQLTEELFVKEMLEDKECSTKKQEAIECLRAIHVQMFNTGDSKWTKAIDIAIESLERQIEEG